VADTVAALRGKTALITGASRGIGRSTAIKLAREGVMLVLVARPSGELDEITEKLARSATAVEADLSQRDEVERAAELVRARVGEPDIIVNNAGSFNVAPFAQMGIDAFERSLQVNVMAPFILARTFLPAMLQRGSGHIVTIGSVADRVIFPDNAAYASGKYGLRAMHEVLRLETRGSGVRATLVSPGPVDTRLWDPIDPDSREGYTPRAAMLDPDSVAESILFVLTRPAHVDIEELRLSRS
jgi:NADP-dependent 3-hydroxy acid dehydrogenase YdfG